MKASINEDLASALDPVRFARTLGIEADDWQDQVLNSQAPQIILNCCRQSGKSTITAIMALHHAMFFPPAMVLIISHTMAQAAETFRKIIVFYHNPDYGRIVNARHYDRLMELLGSGGEIYYSGEHDRDSLFVAPTILVNVATDSPVMQEEIFGPIAGARGRQR